MTAMAVAPKAVVTEDRRGRGVPWLQWLQELDEYLGDHEKYPGCDTVLGRWVSRQRFAFKRGLLPAVQAAQLETLPGWAWDARQDLWTPGLNRLKEYVALHGKIPGRGRVGGWAYKQRHAYAHGHLSDERAELLEAIPGWSWEINSWDLAFSRFAAHIGETGRLPIRGTSLYWWAGTQRIAYAAGTLTVSQVSRLEALPGWIWNRREESWQEQFEQVARAVSESGAYPRSDSNLGCWIAGQRHAYRQGSMSVERIALLENLPRWRWCKPSWDEQYVVVSGYIAENGRLPKKRTIWGSWISLQRSAFREGKLSADQTHKLESLPGWSWGAASAPRSVDRP